MELYIISTEELPEALASLLGKARPALRQGTAYDVAKFMLREGGGADKTDRIWHLVKASEAQDDAIGELEEKVRANMRGYRQYALALSELPVPIHALLEVAERTKTAVFLAAVFEDLESTLSEEENVREPR